MSLWDMQSVMWVSIKWEIPRAVKWVLGFFPTSDGLMWDDSNIL